MESAVAFLPPWWPGRATSPALAAGCVIGALVLLALVIFEASNRWRLRKFPQPPPFPIIGHIPYLLNAPWKRMYEFSAKYGPVYALHIAGKPVICVADPELVKQMFRERTNIYLKDQWSYEKMRDVLGWGLVTSEGKVWRAHRTMMSPAFDFRALEALQSVFDGATKRLVSSLDAAIARITPDAVAAAAMKPPTGGAAAAAAAVAAVAPVTSSRHPVAVTGIASVGDGKTALVELSALFRCVTLEVISEVALCIKGDDAQVFPRLFEAVLDELNMRALRPYRAWVPWIESKHRAAVGELDALVDAAIAARRAQRAASGVKDGVSSSPPPPAPASAAGAAALQASGSDAAGTDGERAAAGELVDAMNATTARINSIFAHGGDMLTMMLDSEEGSKLTDHQLRDEVKTQLMAGHETSSMMMTWGLYLLCKHPEAMAKAVEEVDRCLGAPGSGKVPSFKDFKGLVYLEWVLYEAMRLFTPVPIVNRENQVEDVLGGFTIPAKTTIMVSISFLHADPKVWGDDVNEFRPERFSPEGKRDGRRHPWSYLPFSMGERDCIGRNLAISEAKTVVGTLLQRYTLAMAPCHAADVGHPETDEFVVPLRPRDRLNVTLTPRTVR